ncbi:MAG: ABC transporter ATP-binding protein [Clostridia bacterium]|nr:ABC transporter ATP-binding protein [Clostridia bacterium]
MIKFEHFSFKYTAQADYTLRDINLTINDGEKVLIIGPSGCGKSTLLNCINGLVPFSYDGTIEGSLTVDGKETKDLSIFELSKIVGTVLQDSDAQFVGLTVAEDIAFALENDCIPTEELKRRVKEIAKLVNIESHLEHAPTDISGGQKQRVSLAGVMIDDVKVLLFDEPLANLDPETGKTAIELIDSIHKDTGVTEIIIEHRLEDVLWRDVDRIVLMGDGKIVLDTTPDELLSSDALIKHGIREPLYITALKYAGVEITPSMLPHSIDTITLTDEDIAKVKEWYLKTETEKEEEKEVLLQVRDIDFTYKNDRNGASVHHALDHISFDVMKGELLAIVGRNGAGKSTFSKALCGFERIDSGKFIFKGEDMAPLSIKERADRIGYVMQNPNQMISKVQIFDEVALGLRTRNVPEDEVERRVNDTLKICGLWEFRNWPVSALSYGQKKRVTIASILVLEPEMIILDEPTAGQDYYHYTEIMNFLEEINSRGVTIVLITHDMHLMLEYATRGIVFADSKVIKDSTSYDILTDRDVISRASLKETSLYNLALKCGLNDTKGFVEHFISFERRVRND